MQLVGGSQEQSPGRPGHRVGWGGGGQQGGSVRPQGADPSRPRRAQRVSESTGAVRAWRASGGRRVRRRSRLPDLWPWAPHCSRTAGRGPLTPTQALGLLTQVRLPPGQPARWTPRPLPVPRGCGLPSSPPHSGKSSLPERLVAPPPGSPSGQPAPLLPWETPTTTFLAHLLDVPCPRHWPAAASPLPPPSPVFLSAAPKHSLQRPEDGGPIPTVPWWRGSPAQTPYVGPAGSPTAGGHPRPSRGSPSGPAADIPAP